MSPLNGTYYFGVASSKFLLHGGQWHFVLLQLLCLSGGVASDTRKVITTETASLLSGIMEGDKECKDPFAGLEDNE